MPLWRCKVSEYGVRIIHVNLYFTNIYKSNSTCTLYTCAHYTRDFTVFVACWALFVVCWALFVEHLYFDCWISHSSSVGSVYPSSSNFIIYISLQVERPDICCCVKPTSDLLVARNKPSRGWVYFFVKNCLAKFLLNKFVRPVVVIISHACCSLIFMKCSINCRVKCLEHDSQLQLLLSLSVLSKWNG